MFRTNRTAQRSQIRHEDIAFTTATALVLFAAAATACGIGSGEKQPDTSVAKATPVVAPKPAVANDTTDSSNVVEPKVTFASAQGLYTKRQYRDAAESFDVYVRQHPTNAFGYYMLGLSAWKAGDLDQARDAFEQSLALDSTNVKTLLNLGRVLLDQGQPIDASRRVAAAVAIDTNSAEARRMMARVQLALGQRDSAEASYRLALSLDPADSWSMNNLGLLLIDEGRYADALPPLARAVELRAESPAFANNLGIALERTGHQGEAAQAYRSALQVDSTYGKASRSLARVDGKMDDSSSVDVQMLAQSFNNELQLARQTRLAKAMPPKPEDRIQDPER